MNDHLANLTLLLIPILTIISILFGMFKVIYSKATSDNFHFASIAGFTLLLFGPWFGIQAPKRGIILFNIGLLILIVINFIMVVYSYKDWLDEKDRPLFLQTIIASGLIYAINYSCGKIMIKLETVMNQNGATIEKAFRPEKYQALLINPKNLIIALIIIFFFNMLASSSIQASVQDRILDPIYDHFHPDYDDYKSEKITKKPKQGFGNTPSSNTPSDININKIKKSLASHASTVDASNDSNKLNTEQNLKPVNAAVKTETPIPNNNYLNSYDERGLTEGNEAHARYRIFKRDHQRCIVCGKDVLHDKVVLSIDFKNKALAKKYQRTNLLNPGKIPLNALGVVCENHTIDHLYGNNIYEEKKQFIGSGKNGHITVGDIQQATKKIKVPSYDQRALQYHPNWYEKLVKKYHNSCQICGANPDTPRHHAILKVDFKNLPIANYFMKLNLTHPEQIPFDALTLVCTNHDVSYMTSQTELFYREPKIFKAQQRRVARFKSFREYVTKYGNKRLGFRCIQCGRTPNDLGKNGKHLTMQLDHIYPIAKGGFSRIDNVQWLCNECNNSKSDLA